jgi:hypothetical protein
MYCIVTCLSEHGSMFESFKTHSDKQVCSKLQFFLMHILYKFIVEYSCKKYWVIEEITNNQTDLSDFSEVFP